MATATDTRMFGKSIKRREDPRFITGRGNYTDDLKLPGMTYAAFVRSPHAHAKIRKIDVAQAKAHPGVVAIFTGKDLTGVNSLPCGWLLPELKVPPHPPWPSTSRATWAIRSRSSSRTLRTPRSTRPRRSTSTGTCGPR